ncbi:hypothetical protein HRbin36_02803 [bacterium HR36]|nr:hypothetical protein HRbin36_02803 [bacterium HR36]
MIRLIGKPTAWFCMASSLLQLMTAGNFPAQEVRLPAGLVKTEAGYLHRPSGLEFQTPKDWEVRPAELTKMYAALVLRHRLAEKETVEATLSFAPLEELTLDEARDQELKALQAIYQQKNVEPPVEIRVPTQPPRPGYRIVLNEGPDFKGRQQGVVYLFTTSDEKKTWLVRLRATWNKPVGKQAFAETERLLPQFRLHPAE